MSSLLSEDRGHVRILTLNRPEQHNAMDIELYERLTGRDLAKCPRCEIGTLVRTELPRFFVPVGHVAHREGKGPDP